MEPGDQVILSYEEYTRYKQYDSEIKQLRKQIEQFKLQNTNLNHDKKVAQEKLVLKNALICKEQLRKEYLLCLIGQLKKSFNVKNQNIGEGFNQIKDMEESQFSVLRVTSEKNSDQQLPANFSKSQAFEEIDVEFQTQKTLIQYCTQQLKQKIKTIQYLEKQTKKSSSDQNKSDNQKLKNQLKELTEKNQELMRKVETLEKDLKLQNQMNWKQVSLQKEYKNSSQKQNQALKQQICQLKIVLEETYQNSQRKSSDTARQIQNLKQQIQKLQKQVDQANNQIKLMKGQGSQFSTDVKTKIISLITQYSFELKKSYNEMGLTAGETKELIKSEISEIENQIRNGLNKIAL